MVSKSAASTLLRLSRSSVTLPLTTSPLASGSTSSTSSSSIRSLSTSSHLLSGFFQRPQTLPTLASPSAVSVRKPAVAVPHAPPNVPSAQSPNYPTTWSETQNPREQAMKGPRFEQMAMELQPQPLSAMEMIQREPIRLVQSRIAACDGGDGPLGHPKVYINLDKAGAKACPYCGLRYEQDHSYHYHH